MATALGVFASEPESLPAKHVKPMSVVTLNTLPLLQNYYDKYNLPIAYRQTFTGEHWPGRRNDKRPCLHPLPKKGSR
jgi:hypothetical protein